MQCKDRGRCNHRGHFCIVKYVPPRQDSPSFALVQCGSWRQLQLAIQCVSWNIFLHEKELFEANLTSKKLVSLSECEGGCFVK